MSGFKVHSLSADKYDFTITDTGKKLLEANGKSSTTLYQPSTSLQDLDPYQKVGTMGFKSDGSETRIVITPEPGFGFEPAVPLNAMGDGQGPDLMVQMQIIQGGQEHSFLAKTSEINEIADILQMDLPGRPAQPLQSTAPAATVAPTMEMKN